MEVKKGWPSLCLGFSLGWALVGGWPSAAQEVRLPLASYEELRSRASVAAPAPALPLVFEEARLSITVEEDLARVVERLRVRVTEEGWQRLVLPEVGRYLALEGDGLEVLPATGEGASLLVRGRGKGALRLELVVPLEEDSSATRQTSFLRLPVPSAAVVAGTLRGSSKLEDVEAEPGSLFLPDGEGWSFVATPGGTLQTRLLGPAVELAREQRALRFESLSATAVELSRSRSRAVTYLRARVLEGRLETLEIPLPNGWEVLGAEGEAPVAWRVSEGVLEIVPGMPITDSLEVAVRLHGPPLERLASVVVAPRGALASQVFSKVAVSGDGLLTLVDPGSGMDPEGAQLGTLPQGFRQAPGREMWISHPEEPPAWEVVWSEGVEVLAAEVSRLLVDLRVGLDGRAYTHLWLSARSSGVRDLLLTTLPGLELSEALRDGVPIRPGRQGAQLVLPLASQEKEQVLELAGVVPWTFPPVGPFILELPRLSVPVRRVEVRLLLPGGFRYRLEDPSLAATVFGPPLASRAAKAGPLGQWLLEGERAKPSGEEGAWATPPPGYESYTVGWEALSSELRPLRLVVDENRVRKEWL